MPNPTISTITVGGTTYDIVGGSGYVPHVVVVTDTGSTVTITKGQTTYTATETSTGVFEADITSVNDYGTYTITGSLSGVTTTTTLDIDTVKVYEVDLSPRISVTLTIYSAKEDTISYVDIDGATQTITFASGESSKQVTIEIEPSGSSITFTSGVAKDPSNLSNYYSKTVTITSNTTEVYLMPDNALYWWGYMSDDAEVISSANGWTHTNYTFTNPTFNTTSARVSSSSGVESGIGSKNAINATKSKMVAQGVTIVGPNYGFMGLISAKNTGSVGTPTGINTNTQKLYEFTGDGSSKYLYTATANARVYDLFALWYE